MLGFPVKYVNLFGKKIEVTLSNFKGCINQGFYDNFIDYTKPPFNQPSHGGWDMVTFFREPFLNVWDGLCVYAQRHIGQDGKDYGNLVIMWHPDLGIQTHHRHGDEITAIVGQSYPKGSPLGFCGSTGYSTGVHEHFGVYKATGPKHEDVILNPWGGAVDPMPYYKTMFELFFDGVSTRQWGVLNGYRFWILDPTTRANGNNKTWQDQIKVDPSVLNLPYGGTIFLSNTDDPI